MHQEFTRRFRGYDSEEVEEFLSKVADDYEKAMDENAGLKEEIEQWQKRVQHYEQMEETMHAAVISAQKAGDEIRESAVKEAELIRREAELEKERLLNDMGDVRREKERFKIEFRTLLETHLKMME